MRIKLAIAVFLLACGLANAQTCTPVTVGKVYTVHDDGNGPNFTLGVNNTNYNPGATVHAAAGVVQVGGNQEWGYYNVHAGFGGCTKYWSAESVMYWHLFDNTTGLLVAYSNATASVMHYCGFVASCAFTDNQQPYKGVLLQSGHSYTLTDYMYGLWDSGIGNSITYSASVTIVVQ